MQVVCAQCHTHYELGPEYAGKRVRCRTCQAVIQIPEIDPSTGEPAAHPEAGPGAEPDPYRSPAAAGGGQPPYGVDRAAAFETHRKIVGIFNIIVGVLSLLWVAFCVIGMIVFATMPQHELGRDAPPAGFGLGMYFVMFLLSLIAGVIQLAAGTKVLKGSPGARGMGLASGFVSCASLWGCCVYPFCLASGIYTLIILFGQGAKDFLEVRHQY